MPFKDPEAKKAYIAAYKKERREQLRKQGREWRLKNMRAISEQQEQANRKRGHGKRKTAPPGKSEAAPKVKVTKIRRYTIIEDRVYFNRESGFTPEEIQAVLKDLKEKAKEYRGEK